MKLNQQIVEDDAPKICSLCNKEITARTAIGITERDKDNIWGMPIETISCIICARKQRQK